MTVKIKPPIWKIGEREIQYLTVVSDLEQLPRSLTLSSEVSSLVIQCSHP